ncbi:GtrA family protein [Phytohabitans aurantiacus]|uniref:GtrA family protein n=1 Tax=Phytohabitans aurantiacus TaxID=3016789 RepID=UPI002490B7A2|nr:GtrA family protein [Phytohabitans aurantiacus]
MSATVTGEPSAPTPPSGLLRRLWERFGHLVHELGKFGVVGVIAFIVDLILFNIALSVLNMESLTAKVFSTVIAASVAFVGNRFWTWRHRARSNLAREYILYFVLNAIGLGFSLITLAISHYGLGSVWPVFQTPVMDNISANFVGAAMGTTFRFWSYRRWVFLNPDAEPDTQRVPAVVTESE